MADVVQTVVPPEETESIKLTFACPTALKADLDRYAALHAPAYGEAVDVATLIPHMLEAFMVGIGGQARGCHAKCFHRLGEAAVQRPVQVVCWHDFMSWLLPM